MHTPREEWERVGVERYAFVLCFCSVHVRVYDTSYVYLRCLLQLQQLDIPVSVFHVFYVSFTGSALTRPDPTRPDPSPPLPP